MSNRSRFLLSIILCSLLALLLSPAVVLAQGEKGSDPDYIFYKGNTLYEESLYDEAIREYSKLHEQGLESGSLYYNIGNCYFRMEDLGRAILFYRRAEQYTPNDPNLHQNMGYARSKRLDRIDVPERRRVMETLFFFHYDLSQRSRAMLFAVFFGLVWGLLTLRLCLRLHLCRWRWCRGSRRPPQRPRSGRFPTTGRWRSPDRRSWTSGGRAASRGASNRSRCRATGGCRR